jgi:hypothetical protein
MKPEWLEVDGKVIGISLGADYCAEHEWGINGLKRALGVDGATSEFAREKPKYTKPAGLPRRMISKHDRVRLYEHKDAVVLLCMDQWSLDHFEERITKNGIVKAFKPHLPQDLTQSELGAAWDEGEFGIHGKGVNAERIKDLYAAFQANNVGIWVGGRAIAFENGGLILCIADRIPEVNAKMLSDGDLDNEKLQAASDATGIVERLKEAGKGFFACSPRWREDKSKKKSGHPVVYWLNPIEQDQNNYGWFTVEELDLWIKGSGPIPKKVQEGQRRHAK